MDHDDIVEVNLNRLSDAKAQVLQYVPAEHLDAASMALNIACTYSALGEMLRCKWRVENGYPLGIEETTGD